MKRILILAMVFALLLTPAYAKPGNGKGRGQPTPPPPTTIVAPPASTSTVATVAPSAPSTSVPPTSVPATIATGGTSGGTTTISVAVIIPLHYDRPDGVHVDADAGFIATAQQGAAAFDANISRYSNGYGNVAARVLVWDGLVTSRMYISAGGGFYVNPSDVRQATGSPEQVVIVATDLDATTAPYGGITSGSNTWVPAYPDVSRYMTHEFGHFLESFVSARGSSPGSCGAVWLIHCGAELGYADDLESAFFARYYSGTLPNGWGFTPSLWGMLQ